MRHSISTSSVDKLLSPTPFTIHRIWYSDKVRTVIPYLWFGVTVEMRRHAIDVGLCTHSMRGATQASPRAVPVPLLLKVSCP